MLRPRPRWPPCCPHDGKPFVHATGSMDPSSHFEACFWKRCRRPVHRHWLDATFHRRDGPGAPSGLVSSAGLEVLIGGPDAPTSNPTHHVRHHGSTRSPHRPLQPNARPALAAPDTLATIDMLNTINFAGFPRQRAVYPATAASRYRGPSREVGVEAVAGDGGCTHTTTRAPSPAACQPHEHALPNTRRLHQDVVAGNGPNVTSL
jgi:hypothetical protein